MKGAVTHTKSYGPPAAIDNYRLILFNSFGSQPLQVVITKIISIIALNYLHAILKFGDLIPFEVQLR